MKHNITMQDIADQFGVSKVTVSKALNDKEGVGEELKDKIKEMAIEMGYRMNSIARSLKNNNTFNIGVIMAERFTNTGYIQQPHEISSFYMDFYQSVSKELDKRHYSAILQVLNPKDEEQVVLPRLYLDNKIDGFIVLGQISHDYICVLQETKMPLVFLDFYDEQIEMDSVTTDNFAGCYRITNYLIKQQHSKIAYLGNIYSTSSIQDRFLGFYKSLLEHKIPLIPEYVISDRNEKGEYLEFAYPKDMPSAFVCNCDQVANLLIRDLTVKGYKIPEDISVVGFDNSIYSTLSIPPITTVEVDTKSMSKASVELLLRKIEGDTYRTGKISVSGKVILRNSVLLFDENK